MVSRSAPIGLGIVALLLLGADSPPRPTLRAREGLIVSVMEIKQGRNGRLVLSDKGDRKRSLLAVPARAPILLNRSPATLGDLKTGDRAIVATDKYDLVTEIIATRVWESVGWPFNPALLTANQ